MIYQIIKNVNENYQIIMILENCLLYVIRSIDIPE